MACQALDPRYMERLLLLIHQCVDNIRSMIYTPLNHPIRVRNEKDAGKAISWLLVVEEHSLGASKWTSRSYHTST